MRRGFLPSASITQIAGASPVFARQKATYLPSGDSLARKSQTGGSTLRQDGDAPVARVEPADLGAASGELGLEVAVEVVDVGALRLEFPRDLGSREASGKEDGAVARPGGHVRSASPSFRVAVGRREPHGLSAGEHAVFAAIGATDADVGPVVPRVFAGEAVDVEDPAPVRRPTGAEVEVPRLGGDADAVRSVGVAGPDLVALRTREMEGNPPPVGTEAQAIGEALAGASELACVGPVEANAEDLADLLAHDLHQDSVVAQQEGRGHEWCQSILGADFVQGTGLEVVEPEVRRSLGVVLVERPPRAVAPRFHAQEDHTPAVGEHRRPVARSPGRACRS